MDALRHKYAPDSLSLSEEEKKSELQPIEISGKTVEEVGFDRIKKQLAELQELKIVLIDTLCVKAISLKPESIQQAQDELSRTCPKIQELDLSRNLIESWDEVADICQPLKHLKILRVGYDPPCH